MDKNENVVYIWHEISTWNWSSVLHKWMTHDHHMVYGGMILIWLKGDRLQQRNIKKKSLKPGVEMQL